LAGKEFGDRCSGIARYGYYRHASQEECPWNIKFAREVKEPSFLPRAVIGEKDAETLAAEILAISGDEFRTAFKSSAMKRAKLGGLRRNAAVALEDAAAFSSSSDESADTPSA
jgi:epoxyqueuosine reductase QueG